MDKYLEANRDLWDEITPVHLRSELYNVEGFKAGKITLSPTSLELKEMGDVTGKSLLHMQCHFGMDTLSFARLGAKVVGIDFSEKAIETARSLSRETGLSADFICCNLYELKDNLKKQFDIVYTSSGVLCWLPDLERWAEIIAYFLKPGGQFYIWEGHPLSCIFDNSETASDFKIAESYFPKSEPTRWEPEGDYTDRKAKVVHPSYEWTHSLGEIINALLGAGLRLNFLHEFPFSAYRCYPFAEKNEDGFFHVKGDKVPLTFSIKAIKPGL